MLEMPQRTLSLSDLVTILVSENKPVIVPDTCTLLDVVRSPVRSGGDAVLRHAVTTAQSTLVGTLPFAVVLPSVLAAEWSDNLDSTKEELNRGLRFHKQISEILVQLHQYHTGVPLAIPDVTEAGYDIMLENICLTIMGSAYTMQREDAVDVRAVERVLQKRPPSRKGKPELKDCIIFEEVLALGRALATHGFGKSVIFCSTNKEEYNPTGKVLAEAAIDLAAANVEFASTFSYAVHLGSQ